MRKTVGLYVVGGKNEIGEKLNELSAAAELIMENTGCINLHG